MTCMYCMSPMQEVHPRKGEHIIQEALGGRRVLPNVCQTCNNGFSDIDMEFASRSPMCLLIWRVLGTGADWIWDYDPTDGLVLEGHLQPDSDSPRLWPQVILDKDRISFRADLAELKAVGHQRYIETFWRFLMCARDGLRSHRKGRYWTWEQVGIPPRVGQFPPRVCCRRHFGDISAKTRFVCRYYGRVDKNEILWRLDNWRPLEKPLALEERIGVFDPETVFSMRPVYILRALVKMGVNMLAHTCSKTVVCRETFRDAIEFITGVSYCGPEPATSGFVLNEAVADLECPPASHKLRLTHECGFWHVDAAYFGGRIGTTVTFPGPCYEDWRTVEVTVPLHSKQWKREVFKTIRPRTMNVEWNAWNRVIPSVPMKNIVSTLRFEVIKDR